MSSTPLLITYYNTVPSTATNYFTIQNGNLTISKSDKMGTDCMLFITNANNNLVYIFNGPNMGSFIIDSLVSSDQTSVTYSITLNSIPLNLVDNILCVLSISVPTYNISRTYLTILNTDIGSFTSLDNTKYTINTQSISTVSNYNSPTSSSYSISSSKPNKTQSDDTLFLYIIATNQSFNIILSSTSIHTVSNVKILPESNSKSIVFSGKSVPLRFTDNTEYQIYISTEDASTVSNIIFNNTMILPLNYSGIDLSEQSTSSRELRGSVADKSKSPSGTLDKIPVKLTQALDTNKNSLNKLNTTQNFVNQCVILNIIDPKYHNLSGYFSLEPINTPSSELVRGLTTNVSEKYEDISKTSSDAKTIPGSPSAPPKIIVSDKPVNNSIFSSLSNISSVVGKSIGTLSNNTYSAVLNTTGISHSTVVNTNSVLSDVSKSAFTSLSYAYKVAKVNTQEKVKPDNINNVPLLVGLPSKLNVSYNDINNNKINFITPNIIIYLSNGISTDIYAISDPINNVDNPDNNTILSFNGEINASTLPSPYDNRPYVLSTGPITPYLTYAFTNSVSYNTPIKNGSFAVMSGSKLLLNNLDINSMNAVPFISLLYTIINKSTTLNILNLDYSVICSLIITGVALSQSQSTISYSILSGTIPSSSTTNYIFTLLQSSDIISSVNNSKIYNDILTKNNNLILGIQLVINKSYINNPEDPSIQQAQTIIANAASQATILLTTPFINNDSTTLQIANATITMAFNAVNYALLGDSDSSELLYFYSVLTQLDNPIIITSILNNVLYHLTNEINSNKTSPNLQLYQDAYDAVNNALVQISVPSALDIPTINTPSSTYIPHITNALTVVNTALVAVPDNAGLLKAQSSLLSIEPITLGEYKIEKMTDSRPDSESSMPNTTQIVIGFICCLIMLGTAAYFINSYLSKNDSQLFSSESSSSSSSSSNSSSD